MTDRTFYERFLRPALFRLPGEVAHDLGKLTLRTSLPWRWMGRRLRIADPRLRTQVGGLALDNPIGVSAGLDKNAAALPGLMHLGFGAITVGSILPERRPGNPKPRLIRYPEQESMLNCYGLPSVGLAAGIANLRRRRAPTGTMVIANIDAPTVALYLRSFEAIQDHVDAIELGLQCPNNRDDSGEMHEPRNFERLLQGVAAIKRKPVFVKMGFYVSDAERQNRLGLVEMAARHGLDAVVIPGIYKKEDPAVSLGIGATSGRVTFARNLATVKDVVAAARGRIAVKSNGGVFSGADALTVLSAGAVAIDILTAIVYRGWEVAARINRELLEAMDRERIPDLAALRLAPARRADALVAA
ncbi:MAG: dihydroorotate dehydrogenase 2 [Candidatus Odyssella sp.]|nr:dihydroorotate dehydrogenase 2 [Candidatus Odyssella sp.]